MSTLDNNLQEHNFEVYTINPETKETGWDIKFISVIAKDYKTAKQYLKQWPLFDCIILHNYSTKFDGTKYPEFIEGRLFDTDQYTNPNEIYNLIYSTI